MSIKIFISCLHEDYLREEKTSLIKLLKEELKLTPIYYSEREDSEYDSNWQQENIKKGDIFILLIEDNISSSMFEELEIARYYKKHLIIFVKDEEALLREDLKSKELKEEKLRYIHKIIKDNYFPFKDFQDIKNRTIEKIISLLRLPSKLPSNLPIDKEEIDKVEQVYVRPKNKYDKAYKLLSENRYLFICGPAHIGKAITAISLLLDIKNEYNLDTLIRCKISQIEEIYDLENAGILFDNIFSALKLEVDELIVKNIFEAIERLKKKNFIVTTLKRKEFHQLLTMTERVENINMESYVDINEESDYSDEDLQEILRKHLRRIPKLTNIQTKLIESNIERIITELRFPHNIEHFVTEHIKEIKDEESLNIALREAKEIDKFIQHWFYDLPTEEKFVVFTIALYEGFTEEEFKKVYEKVFKILRSRFYPQLTFSDISKVRSNISSYITSFGNINFRHPSYHNGVLKGIEERYFDVATTVLKELSSDSNWMIRLVSASSLGELSKLYLEKRQNPLALTEDGYARWSMKPEKIIPILENLADDPIWNVRWVVASSLGEIVKKLPKKVLPILISLTYDDQWHVRQMAGISLRKVVTKFPEQLIPVFERLSKDENKNIRWIAINALCDLLEIRGEEVIPLLKEIAEKSEKKVKKYIEENIQKAKG